MPVVRGNRLGHRISLAETPTPSPAKPATRVAVPGRNDIEAWHQDLQQRAAALMQKRVRCEAALEEAERQERELLRKAHEFGVDSLEGLERKVAEQETADRTALAEFEAALDREEAAQAEVERALREIGD